MIEFFASLFIKNRQNTTDSRVREGYGTLCSIVGIILNLLMFAGKYLAGLLTASISITADAFNNLSDAGSSLITLLGFKLANRKPDPDHPFGHGRIEYISGFIVSLIILLLAFELGKSSVEKILNPSVNEWSVVGVVILGAAILVKGYMALYNYRIGKKIDSAAMRATGADSLSDMISTAAVLLGTILSHLFNWQLDGWLGLLVSIFILINGIGAARDTLAPMLGTPADKEDLEALTSLVLAHKEIGGVHDMVIHDYGPGRRFISLHAEVPADCDILAIHDVIDNIEKEVQAKMGAHCTIHMDPVEINDALTCEYRDKVRAIVSEIDPEISIHDFRLVRGETHTNLLFDAVVPFKFRMSDNDVVETIQQRIFEEIGKNYYAVIEIDRPY